MSDTLLDRFLRYVQVYTTSDASSDTYPSTKRQWDLLHMLADELRELGASDVTVDDYGYVMATVPATVDTTDTPTVAFLAHVDTAPDYSGENVKPIVHCNYDGGRIDLPNDNQSMDPANPLHTSLLSAVGKDVITSSGDTLLGADDKAGVAIVMTLVDRLLKGKDLKHGTIRVCFTPDEEIGQGVTHLSLDKLGANLGYTLDGADPGEISWETFSADGAQVTITGVSTHPGTARQYGMVNSVHLAGKLLAMLPRERLSPELTEDYMGYIHPIGISGTTAQTTVNFILRDHDNDLLAQRGEMLKAICAALQASYPTARIDIKTRKQYRNMAYWLRDDIRIVDLAKEACANVGLEPYSVPMRGGTDGSRLTEMGLPTPNIFTGMHNVHGPLEWVALQDMEAATDVLVELSQLWAQRERAMSATSPSLGDVPLTYNEAGLIPAILQDENTGDVLMMAWMNTEALELTRQTGQAHFWSRSRQELWHKGATSGNVMHVRSITADCDGDTLLLKVNPAGPACHTGAKSCFHNPLGGA